MTYKLLKLILTFNNVIDNNVNFKVNHEYKFIHTHWFGFEITLIN